MCTPADQQSGCEPIVSTPGVRGGKPRVAGRGIKVADVAVWHEQMGLSLDEIAAEYDLTHEQITAALDYYSAHREEIDRSIAEGRAFAEEMRRRTPSLLDQRLREPGRSRE